MARDEKKLVASLPEEIYVLPNVIPWNKLLLDGKLKLNYGDNIGGLGVKTREYLWPSQSAQPFTDWVLLYNSSRKDRAICGRHQITEKQPEKALVGLGFLLLVHYLTETERAEWLLRAHNAAVNRRHMGWAKSGLLPGGDYPVVTAGAVGLIFGDLVRFEQPIEFKWPAGPVQSLRIKTDDIRGQLLSASMVKC